MLFVTVCDVQLCVCTDNGCAGPVCKAVNPGLCGALVKLRVLCRFCHDYVLCCDLCWLCVFRR